MEEGGGIGTGRGEAEEEGGRGRIKEETTLVTL